MLNGSREGLFFAAITAALTSAERKGLAGRSWCPTRFIRPMPPAPGGPADCEAIYLPTTLANGFLPDLDALDDSVASSSASRSGRKPLASVVGR